MSRNEAVRLKDLAEVLRVLATPPEAKPPVPADPDPVWTDIYGDDSPPPVPAAPGLQEAVEGIENVLTGMDWIGTGTSQKAADDDERRAWQQWGVILSALGDYKRVYKTGGDFRVAVPAASGLDDSERALLRELATGSVAFEIPGKYVEVQHDPGTWHRAQEWLRLHPAAPEQVGAVPAAPLDMEMHHVLGAIADDEDGGPGLDDDD